MGAHNNSAKDLFEYRVNYMFRYHDSIAAVVADYIAQPLIFPRDCPGVLGWMMEHRQLQTS